MLILVTFLIMKPIGRRIEMNNNNTKLRCYLASSWFTPETRKILDYLEYKLSNVSDIELYSPRRDGIMLPPNQKHDTALRESIFAENISQITASDFVLANIFSGDSYNDPGTIYEIGYAMAHNVPVIGYSDSKENIEERFKGIIDGFEFILIGTEDLDKFLQTKYYLKLAHSTPEKDKVLFVGSGNSEVDNKLVSYIMDSGANLRWVNEMHSEIYSRIDEIFNDVEYMIAVIDDRKTISSWMIGQAYARKIPVITYSDYNYGINVMLLVSVLTHIRGTEELNEFLHQVSRYGLESIPKFDIAQLDSM